MKFHPSFNEGSVSDLLRRLKERRLSDAVTGGTLATRYLTPQWQRGLGPSRRSDALAVVSPAELDF